MISLVIKNNLQFPVTLGICSPDHCTSCYLTPLMNTLGLGVTICQKYSYLSRTKPNINNGIRPTYNDNNVILLLGVDHKRTKILHYQV